MTTTDTTTAPAAIEVVTVEHIASTRIWIESDLLGARHVVLQHECCEPFDYASFGYDHRYTSNAGTWAAALQIARALGATEPVEHRTRGLTPEERGEAQTLAAQQLELERMRGIAESLRAAGIQALHALEDENMDGPLLDKSHRAMRALRAAIDAANGVAQAAPAAGPQLPGLPLPATRSDANGELFDAVQMRQHAVRYAHAALAAAQAPALPGGWRCWADDRMAHLTRDGLSLTFARESHDTRERGAAEFIAAAAQAAPAAAPADTAATGEQQP